MTLATEPLDALLDTFPGTGGILSVQHHPALCLPVAQWPEHALARQEACGIAWDWADILRFFKYVERQGDCLIWIGAKSRGQGNQQWYGSFWTKGKTVRAHKFAAVAILGFRPTPGQEVDHGCDNSRCVSCVRPLSRVENQAKIRRPKKADLVLAKFLAITPAEVLSLSADRRKGYENLMAVSLELEAGRVPPNVIVCSPRRCKH